MSNGVLGEMLHPAPTYPPLADDGPDLQEILVVCMLKILCFIREKFFMSFCRQAAGTSDVRYIKHSILTGRSYPTGADLEASRIN